MKKFVFSALTLCAVLPAAQAACTFNTSTVESIREIVTAAGGWPISDAQCAVLNAKKLSLLVSGDATVLDGVSVAWAAVSLIDSSSRVKADAGRTSTYVNTKKASIDVANEMLVSAVKDSLAQLDFNKAAAEIEAYKAKNKARR